MMKRSTFIAALGSAIALPGVVGLRSWLSSVGSEQHSWFMRLLGLGVAPKW